MKQDPTPPDSADGKTPFERFTELGKKIMRVPRDEIDAAEKKWQAQRARKRRLSDKA
jgi:hypothetical protein